MDQVARLRVADDFVRRLAAALRGAQLYAPSHPLVQRAFDSLNEALTQLLTDQPSIAIGIIGQEIIVGDMPLPKRRRVDGRDDPAAARPSASSASPSIAASRPTSCRRWR